jgi:hypothetical protein
MSEPIVPPASDAMRRRAGWLAALVILSLYGGMALSVDFPKVGLGFQSDEATYYLMGRSLAADGDLAYRREDLQRAFEEYPSGPAGVFLKKGQRVTGAHLTLKPPFLVIDGQPDPDRTRLFFGKSFIYPLCAAPFVWLFGTNGFLVFNALLLAAAFLAAYGFVSARSGTVTGLLMAGAFIFATVVPAYAVWMTPELFNFTLGLVAYYLWLRKVAAAGAAGPAARWLTGPVSDALAAALIGIATFSKVTNVLLLGPIVVWWLVRRDWRRALVTTAVWALVTAGLFGANVAITGDWNYQGGDRSTYYAEYPFQQPNVGFDVGSERARNEALPQVIFDPQVFWTNLGANLEYFVVGRNSGLVPYFFPAVVALLAFAFGFGRREPWQWFVLAGLAAEILIFIVSQPYTYFGGGGSLGNRYFMGAYGICLFLLPPVRSNRWAVAAWLVGGLFMGKVVLNPFYVSAHPDQPSKTGLFRLLPVELTNVNDLPVNTDTSRVRIWYGDNPGLGDPGFEVYYLDDNAYLREMDKSFWVRGRATAQVLIKTDRPFTRLQLTLTAGLVPTTASVTFRGRTERASLAAGASTEIQLALGPGFVYKKDSGPTYVWVLSIGSSAGFTPMLFDPASPDTRFLGIRVKPVIIP